MLTLDPYSHLSPQAAARSRDDRDEDKGATRQSAKRELQRQLADHKD